VGDRLYYAQISHDEFVEAMGTDTYARRLLDKVNEIDDEDLDLTGCVFVTAESAAEAQERVRDHFGVETPAVLVPSGFVTIRAQLFEPGVAPGVRGEIDWRELEECPECHSNHIRNDASAGATDCISCGWSMDWKEKQP
jgi:hypothetical protein